MFPQSRVAATLIAAFVGLSAEAAQAQVPTINVQDTCRVAAGVTVSLGTPGVDDVKICTDSENKARDQIIKDWGSYPASDRAQCVQTRYYLPSYVEWLTCFEMNKVVREARQQRTQVPSGGAQAQVPSGGAQAQGALAGARGSLGGPLTNPDGSITLPPVRSLGIMR